jgi:putative ABC transport system permease protein
VQPGGAFGGPTGLSPEVAATMATVPGVDVVARFAADLGSITYAEGDKTDDFIGAVDPATYGQVARPRLVQGELEDLQPGGVILHEDIVEDHDLEIGDTVEATFNGGATATVEVQAVSNDPFMLLPITFHLDDLTRYSSQALDFQVLASVDDGADVATVVDDVSAALEEFPGVTVLDRDGYIGTTAAQLSALVNVIYGLLGLSLVIAMIGVANTLSLSVHERTRELGLLRAVGMTRSQLKSAIRWEAVMIAVLGTLVGLGIGLVCSYALIKALEGDGLTAFKIPYLTLLIQVLIAAGFAVIASLRTARRAGRLNVLDAIATE